MPLLNFDNRKLTISDHNAQITSQFAVQHCRRTEFARSSKARNLFPKDLSECSVEHQIDRESDIGRDFRHMLVVPQSKQSGYKILHQLRVNPHSCILFILRNRQPGRFRAMLGVWKPAPAVNWHTMEPDRHGPAAHLSNEQ